MARGSSTPICDPDNDSSQAKGLGVSPADAGLAEQALPPSPKHRQNHFIETRSSSTFTKDVRDMGTNHLFP